MVKDKHFMNLGAFLFNFGHHYSAWRHPESKAKGTIDLDFYKRTAIAAERGKFDMLFLADTGSIPNINDVATNVSFIYPEAVTLLGALAGLTENIGLVGTVSTTFNEPYSLARRFATLDHLSGGRAAWNVVTSTKESEALNYNAEKLLEHNKRYERAAEFLEVVSKLWDSWEDGTVQADKEKGIYAHTDRIHAIEYSGSYFKVQGPLNIPRPPQGRPVIVQAGTSQAGQELAAQTADVVFTACEEKEEAIRFYRQLKERLPLYGRLPEDLKVMPGLLTFIGATEEEAIEKKRSFDKLIPDSAAVKYLSRLLNIDVTEYPINEPLPELSREGSTSRAIMVMDMAARTGLNIRELGLHFAVARGHLTITGTPEQIADQMEDWFVSGACDGFNVMPPLLPDGLDEFVNSVVPLLQQRGLFRTEYTGKTLRENLGLKRPASNYTIQSDKKESF